MTKRFPILLVAGLTLALGACATDETPDGAEEHEITTETEAERDARLADEREGLPAAGETDEGREARELLTDAVEVAQKMRAEDDLRQLLTETKGVFIVPDYGKGAVGIGVQAGEGVLLARDGGAWSAPVFYDIGAISVGPQLGAAGGEIALLLMTDEALDSFKGDQDFDLTADAGLTLVDYSARVEERLGEDDDVILWSDTEGAFAGASLGVTGLNWDEEENRSYYEDDSVTADTILSGEVTDPKSDELQRALANTA